MNLSVHNIARVATADLQLGQITVVSGSNGSGKSTISRSLMTLSSVSRRMAELVQGERFRSVVNLLRKAFAKHGADILIPSLGYFSDKISEWSQLLTKEKWDDINSIRTLLTSNNSVFCYPDSFFNSQEFVTALQEVKAEVLNVLSRPESDYVGYVCSKTFGKAFNEQIKPLFDDSKDLISLVSLSSENGEISVGFRDGELNQYQGIGLTFFSSVLYFEPINYIDFLNNLSNPVQDRYTAGDSCVCKAVSAGAPKNLSIEENEELREAKKIINDIVKIMHGSLVDDNQDISFQETFSDGTKGLINVKNIASGMKTMSAIVRAVENRSVRKESLLIIDEPESNLHPEWQLKFAMFLVLLSKRLDVKLLLNTHSPYFLQAIVKYAARIKVDARFYNMEPDDNRNSYSLNDVTDDIGRVFSQMSRPFNELIGD